MWGLIEQIRELKQQVKRLEAKQMTRLEQDVRLRAEIKAALGPDWASIVLSDFWVGEIADHLWKLGWRKLS